MLYGEYTCAVDEKGRIIFPAKLRDALGESFMVTRWLENCLVVFHEREWEYIAEQLSAIKSQTRRDIKLYLYPGASEAKPDKQGRVVIPPNLRRHAGLAREAVVIGMGRHAEIWDAEAWEAQNARLDNRTIQSTLGELDF